MSSDIKAERYDRRYSDRELIRRLVHYLLPQRRALLIMSAAVFLMAIISALLPLTIAQGVGAVAANANPALIVWLGVGSVAIGVITWLLNWIRRLFTVKVVAEVMLAIRKDAFNAAIYQDLAFYDEFDSGRVISRVTSDTQQLGEVIILGSDIINQLSFVLIIFVVLMGIEWRLALITLLMGGLIILATQRFRVLSRHSTQQSARSVGEVNNAIQESIMGIRVAKNFRQEETIYREFQALNKQAYTINIRRELVLTGIFPVLQVLTGATTAALIYVGGLSAVLGIISLASWYLFLIAIDRFWLPFSSLSAFWSQFQAALSATERIFALLDAAPSIHQIASHTPPRLRGDIELKGVALRYSQKEQVLKDFSLHIAPKESIALVGHTGSGKSSIIKIIARLYEFQEGAVLIDGHDIRTLGLAALRRQIGIVAQDPFLFSGTVAENIRYANPQATDTDLIQMAQRIGNGEWLRTFPNGLQSEVGERGSYLSMGQRQLVALMRVLVQSPAIFILDEATASIDPFTEAQIQEALNLIMQESTAIFIAHRLSTVRSVDRIIVLQHGQIIEQGTHSALLQQHGHYAELYDTFFRHQSPNYQPGRDLNGRQIHITPRMNANLQHVENGH